MFNISTTKLARTMLSLLFGASLLASCGGNDQNAATQSKLLALTDSAAKVVPTVYIAGDSTVMSYHSGSFPQQGWGARIPEYFNANVVFSNKAIGGRSSKSFVNEGRLDEILNLIKPGDFLLIQFGHNDQLPAATFPDRHTDPQTTYKDYLRLYINGAKKKGAIPILVTPMTRRSFNATTKTFNNSLGAYPEAMRELGPENGVHVVDLNTDSINYLNSIGFDASAKVFMILKAGEYPNFPNGQNDATHFQENGANQMARLVAHAIKAQNIRNLGVNVIK